MSKCPNVFFTKVKSNVNVNLQSYALNFQIIKNKVTFFCVSLFTSARLFVIRMKQICSKYSIQNFCIEIVIFAFKPKNSNLTPLKSSQVNSRHIPLFLSRLCHNIKGPGMMKILPQKQPLELYTLSRVNRSPLTSSYNCLEPNLNKQQIKPFWLFAKNTLSNLIINVPLQLFCYNLKYFHSFNFLQRWQRHA